MLIHKKVFYHHDILHLKTKKETGRVYAVRNVVFYSLFFLLESLFMPLQIAFITQS